MGLVGRHLKGFFPPGIDQWPNIISVHIDVVAQSSPQPILMITCRAATQWTYEKLEIRLAPESSNGWGFHLALDVTKHRVLQEINYRFIKVCPQIYISVESELLKFANVLLLAQSPIQVPYIPQRWRQLRSAAISYLQSFTAIRAAADCCTHSWTAYCRYNDLISPHEVTLVASAPTAYASNSWSL